jgi:hypothetical protein
LPAAVVGTVIELRGPEITTIIDLENFVRRRSLRTALPHVDVNAVE